MNRIRIVVVACVAVLGLALGIVAGVLPARGETVVASRICLEVGYGDLGLEVCTPHLP